MAATNWEPAFAEVIGHEGGFTADPRDRGNWTTGRIGEGKLNGTKYGISAMSYPDTNIRDLTLAEAKAIYRRDYWAKVRGDDLPPGIDLVVFDLAVNSGPGRAAEYLQKAVGVPADGKIGPITLYAADNADPLTVIDRICDRRLAFMPVYGKGWSARVLRVRTIAKQWSGASRPAPPPDDPGPEIIVLTPTTPAVPWWKRWLNTLGYLRRL
jgi:lysozyme family protein